MVSVCVLKSQKNVFSELTINLKLINMKMKHWFLNYSIVLMGFVLVFSSGCKKDNDNTDSTLPILTTSSLSNITLTTASSGGNISSDGGSDITARGVCWSTSSNPTISDNKTINGNNTGSFTSALSGLSASTKYYIRAYATNEIGTGYGNVLSFTTGTVAIGDSYQGGIVAYILQPNDPGYVIGQTHGLIAAPTDQGDVKWYNYNYIMLNATATNLGSGITNTNAIVAGQGNGNYAAKICADLVLGGYSDWYLPSKDELLKLYDNQFIIGEFEADTYWSSTEYDANNAWRKAFCNGTEGYINKQYSFYIRAVRSF